MASDVAIAGVAGDLGGCDVIIFRRAGGFGGWRCDDFDAGRMISWLVMGRFCAKLGDYVGC